MDYLLKIKYLETLLVKTKESFLSKNRKVLKPKLYHHNKNFRQAK